MQDNLPFLRCEGQQSCEFKVRTGDRTYDGYKNSHFSDVCNEEDKEIAVNYKCSTNVTKCEGGNIE